jgi:hypothetical protein
MLYIFEMSLHQVSRWLRNLMSTSGILVSMSSPLARHTLRPVDVGSTTILTGGADASLLVHCAPGVVVAELRPPDQVLLLLGEGLELHHEATLDQVLVGSSELLLDRFRFSALGLVDTKRLVAVVVSLVLFTQELHFVAHERETYHNPPGVVVDGDAFLDDFLFKGFLKALGFFPC